MEMTGGCLCGKVRYRAIGVESDYHVCHCGMCRRVSGGPGFATGVAALKFDNETDLGRYDSSDWAERGFCRRCGSTIFYRLKSADGYHLWIGTLDDQSKLRLVGEIFIDDKPPGYALAGDHPRMTGEQFMAMVQSGEASD